MKAVLRWLKKNATKAAIRYYWPAILQVLPAQFAEYQECPQRFADPLGIESLSPFFRNTMATMTSAKLLSDSVEPVKREGLVLTFSPDKIRVNDFQYTTDNLSVNI